MPRHFQKNLVNVNVNFSLIFHVNAFWIHACSHLSFFHVWFWFFFFYIDKLFFLYCMFQKKKLLQWKCTLGNFITIENKHCFSEFSISSKKKNSIEELFLNFFSLASAKTKLLAGRSLSDAKYSKGVVHSLRQKTSNGLRILWFFVQEGTVFFAKLGNCEE